MTDKIIKMAHGNTEYDLGNSQDDNFQMLEINERGNGNSIKATVYLQKINNNWVSIHAKVIEADIMYSRYTFEIKGVLPPFIPKKSGSVDVIADGVCVGFLVDSNGTLDIYCKNSKISYDSSRPVLSDFYALN